MPWKEVTVEMEKHQFIEEAQAEDTNIAKLCRSYGISRKTGYKWLSRIKAEGAPGLKPRSRRPKHSPRKIDATVEAKILSLARQFPGWGGEKLKRYGEAQGHAMPSEKTIDRLLKRHGLVSPASSEKHRPWQRFEHARPNDLWQMDFKGHFLVGSGRCHPLTLLDDHSRYSLLLKACQDEQRLTVQQSLIAVFRDYGLPLGMTMDNGSPWGYSGSQQKHTRLSAWLIQLGIYVSHSRPGHPQTQGKLERFHRTLNEELLSHANFPGKMDIQTCFDQWRHRYNQERPHAAIGYQVPAQRYAISDRPYPESLPAIEYDTAFHIRKVQAQGLISYRGRDYRVGEAFRGKPVGLIPNPEQDRLLDIFFCQQKIAHILLE